MDSLGATSHAGGTSSARLSRASFGNLSNVAWRLRKSPFSLKEGFESRT